MNLSAAILFTVTSYLIDATPPLDGLVVTPPVKHHFNIEAPMKVTFGSAKFAVKAKSKSEIIFESDSSLAQQGNATVEAFLCDDAKTYCVKKTVTINLHEGQKKISVARWASMIVKTSMLQDTSTEKKQSEPKKIKTKDPHGFYENAPEEAFKESKTTGKPLLIDFYAIWCPPCNLLNETVFPKPAFKKAAKDFVLLKMDADLASSWELKSRYNIRGYPTLVFVNSDQSEISRVVGFLNPNSLVERMSEAKSGMNIPLSERVAKTKGTAAYSGTLKKAVNDSYEATDFAATKSFIEEGLKTFPHDIDFKIFELKLACKEKDNKCVKDSSVIEQANKELKTIGTQALLYLVEMEMDSNLKIHALNGINELKSRLNSKTMQVDGFDVTAADLDYMVVDVADASGDEALKKRAMEDGIASYKKLISHFNNQDSRGLNLELAYLLRKSGKLEEAKAIYSKFIKKYPEEFTYYLHFAKFYQEQKDFDQARKMVDNAVKYSYGDNRIRCIDAQAKIMNDQGKKAEAIEVISRFLSEFKVPDASLKVRTRKHLDNLKEYKEKLEKNKS